MKSEGNAHPVAAGPPASTAPHIAIERKSFSVPNAVYRADLVMSCIHIELLEDTFVGAVVPYPGNEDFKKLRIERTDLFFHRRGESALVIPLVEDAPLEGTRKLSVSDHLPALRALVSHRLPAMFPEMELRRRQFEHERIGREFDILEQVFKRAGIVRPAALAGFYKFPRTGLGVHILAQPAKEPALSMTVRFRQRCEITPTAKELIERDFNLMGCWVYDPAVDSQDRWIGRIIKRDGRYLVVEGERGRRHVLPDHYRVESRKETFLGLLSQVFRPRAMADIEQRERELMAASLSGDGYLRKLCQYAEQQRSRGTLEAAPSVRLRFGDLVQCNGRRQFDRLPPTQYCFSAADRSVISSAPSSGIERFGPYQRCDDTPRILIVHPEQELRLVKRFVNTLLHGRPDDKQGRLRRGFLRTFGFTDAELRWVQLPPAKGTVSDADRYRRAIRDGWEPSWRPDIVLVFLGEEVDEHATNGPYIAAKAQLLMDGIPSQEVRMETVNAGPNQIPFIMENIAVALHAKLGGTPWTVVAPEPSVHEVVLGMAHAEVGSRFAARKRYMGITTIFTNNGTYLRAASSGRCPYDEYPAALTRSVADVLSRLKEDHAWRAGDRVRLVVHTHKPLKNTDVASVVRAATRELEKDITFEAAYLTIHRDHPWKVVEPRREGRNRGAGSDGGRPGSQKGDRVPARGTVVRLAARQRLLCMKDGPLMLLATDPMPQPLKLELHKQSTYRELDLLTRQVLDFAGLSWKSVRCISEPVTTYYAHLIADHLNKLSAVEGWSDHVLDSQLARSCWFL